MVSPQSVFFGVFNVVQEGKEGRQARRSFDLFIFGRQFVDKVTGDDTIVSRDTVNDNERQVKLIIIIIIMFY